MIIVNQSNLFFYKIHKYWSLPLIFYKFASEFLKLKKTIYYAIKNHRFYGKNYRPKKKETIIDPTCGIGDFYHQLM